MTSKFYEVKVLLRSKKREAEVEQMIADAIEALLQSQKGTAEAEQMVADAIEVLAVKAKRLARGGRPTTKPRSSRRY